MGTDRTVNSTGQKRWEKSRSRYVGGNQCHILYRDPRMYMAKSPNFGFWILDFGLERRRRAEAGHKGKWGILVCSLLFSI